LIVGRVEDGERADVNVECTLSAFNKDVPSMKVVVDSEDVNVGVAGVGARSTG
jgi:hypothetical protein